MRLEVDITAKAFKSASGKRHEVLDGIRFSLQSGEVAVLVGPSGCGKSTLLRILTGLDHSFEGTVLRPQDARIGMVFQKPNPFPKSIYDNVAWGAKVNGIRKGMDELVEWCLRSAALWDEVKDKLDQSGLALSGGQQQRLCIARALANNPDVILMDEPCSALDPIATARIEELIDELRQNYCIVIVTHSMQQAARVSQLTAFFHLGTLVEYGDTDEMFTAPQEKRTQDYITGRFG